MDQEQALVQIVENHAEISGELMKGFPSPDRPGFLVLTIRVDAAHAIANWPNLFARDVGSTIEVLAREGSQAALTPPGPVRLKVRKAGLSTSFAE
ncbi:MAG TPA: hypothetical protein VIV63_16865 [Steroidobacteraceae bacterium]